MEAHDIDELGIQASQPHVRNPPDDGDYKTVVVHTGGWRSWVVVPGLFCRWGREKPCQLVWP
jgi:hypothetical protein